LSFKAAFLNEIRNTKTKKWIEIISEITLASKANAT
jgi:hypothetical protein